MYNRACSLAHRITVAVKALKPELPTNQLHNPLQPSSYSKGRLSHTQNKFVLTPTQNTAAYSTLPLTQQRTMANQPSKSAVRSLWQDLEKDTLTLINRPIPEPKPNSDEHLIRVHATALCAGELSWPKSFPIQGKQEIIPGYDLAGTVVAAPETSPFAAGSQVYARTNYVRPGCARDYTIAVTSELALRPSNLSWAESATIPLSALTAWQALFVQGGLGGPENPENKGKRVFITAASGGVGLWVVQLARIAGLHVSVSCGSENEQFVRDLGANEVVDYKTMSITAWAAADENRKVDLVIDCFGNQTLKDAWGAVKDGGTLISIVQPPEERKPANCTAKNVKNFFFIMEPNGAQLAKVTELVLRGKCHGVLDSTFKLEEFEQAFAKVDTRRARGKVVLSVHE
ncbi:alcohol dehydrogenase [Histoplasma capsulatum G186AR]|nr:alcohol dehydrogenase [Histoplasma capsulatum]QSS67840.1 alcohol dehydrogenase [Histoplasma capsulatum G186AR]